MDADYFLVVGFNRVRVAMSLATLGATGTAGSTRPLLPLLSSTGGAAAAATVTTAPALTAARLCRLRRIEFAATPVQRPPVRRVPLQLLAVAALQLCDGQHPGRHVAAWEDSHTMGEGRGDNGESCSRSWRFRPVSCWHSLRSSPDSFMTLPIVRSLLMSSSVKNVTASPAGTHRRTQ